MMFAASAGLALLDEYAAAQVDTKEAWAAFAAAQTPTCLPRLTLARYEALSPADKLAYDEERRTYLSRFTIETPSLTTIRNEALQLLRSNLRRTRGARTGVVIDGLGTLGKTTIATEIGRAWERELRQCFGIPFPVGGGLGEADDEAEFVPVAYTTLADTNFNQVHPPRPRRVLRHPAYAHDESRQSSDRRKARGAALPNESDHRR
jgi:hypothetical protein